MTRSKCIAVNILLDHKKKLEIKEPIIQLKSLAIPIAQEREGSIKPEMDELSSTYTAEHQQNQKWVFWKTNEINNPCQDWSKEKSQRNCPCKLWKTNTANSALEPQSTSATFQCEIFNKMDQFLEEGGWELPKDNKSRTSEWKLVNSTLLQCDHQAQMAITAPTHHSRKKRCQYLYWLPRHREMSC